MSAILYPVTQWLDSQKGSNTGSTPPPLQAATDTVDAALRFAQGGISKLDGWMGGGFHPEAVPAAPPVTSTTVATDSVQGRFGGLIPRPASTVAPGPAGVAASQRSNLFNSLKRVVGLPASPGIAPEPPPNPTPAPPGNAFGPYGPHNPAPVTVHTGPGGIQYTTGA